MIKVLHVTSTPHVTGGVESLLLQVSRHHDPVAFEIHFCNLFFAQSSFVDATTNAGWDSYSLGEPHWWSVVPTVLQLRRLIRRLRPDVIDTHMVHSSIATAVAVRGFAGPPLIATRHYSTGQLSRRSVRMLDEIATRRADEVVVVSLSIRDEAMALGVDPAKIHTIPNGMDLRTFDLATSGDAPPWPHDWSDGIIFITVGNLFSYKGHRELIRAFSQALHREPRLRLAIVGEGPERNSLAALVTSSGLSDRVMLLGRRVDVPALLRKADAYVHSSSVEAFGIAVIEAMAAKLAVVSTSVGGLPDIVEHGTTGLLVPSQDVTALASAMLAIALDVEGRKKMGLAGRARVEQRFTIELVARACEAVWTRAVSARSS